MAKPSFDPHVSARVGGLIAQIAAARGSDAATLLADCGFEAHWLDDSDAKMPLSLEQRLWELAAQRCNDPLFGLHAAQVLQPGAFDVLDYVVRTAPDLRTALERLSRYNRLVHDVALFELQSCPNGGVRIEHRFASPLWAPSRHAAEFTLASLVVVASQIGGIPVRATAVTFRHAAAAAPDAYREVFGVAPVFGQPVNSLELSGDVLARPVQAADPALARIVTAHAEQLLRAMRPRLGPVAESVRQQLAQHMAQGPLTLNQVARNLHVSARSLQRRLEAEGTGFNAVAEEVRHALALRYVADSHLALGEVAYLLGFSEPSAFHRAFKRWTGSTPAAARTAATRGSKA